jgi:tryptophan synthase alpha chain
MIPLSAKTRALQTRDKKKALVAYLTAGYPDEETFGVLMRAVADAGADIIEIGIPFSDPIADGPVIQASSNAALARGATLARALEVTARLQDDVRAPLVVMSYINPILRMGVERFANEAVKAGVSGVVLPDVSFEESPAFRPVLRAAGLSYIDLIAPTSHDGRVDEIARASEGFVYLVSITGVTGSRAAGKADVATAAARVRAATETPVYVGFGIATPEAASEIASVADGVIIGSRLVQLAGEGGAKAAAGRVGDFVASVRAALDGRGATQRRAS